MIIPNGYGQITHRFGGTGYPLGAAITLGFARADANLSADEVAALAHDALADIWASFWSQDTQLQSTLVKFGPNSTGSSAEFSSAVNGTGSAETMSPNTALLIRKNTAVGGRSGRGRMYMVGLADTSVLDGGDIGGSAQTAAQLNCNTWFTRAATENWPMALLHAAVSDPTPISSLSVQSRAATQRRRLRR